MALVNSAIMVLLPSLMITTTMGLCDFSLPLVGDPTDSTLDFHLPHNLRSGSEMRRQEDFQSNSKRTKSCGTLGNEESGESMEHVDLSIEFDPTDVNVSSEVSASPGSFPAELLIPVIIFALLLYFGTSLVIYVIIPLLIIMFLFSLYKSLITLPSFMSTESTIFASSY